LNAKALFLTLIMTASIGRATLLFSDPGGGNSRTGDGFSLGAQFTVSVSNEEVIGLGIYDLTGNALLTAHEVGLWDVTAGNTMVADVTVPAGTTNGGTPGFVFVAPPSPVVLFNGHQYKLAAYYPSGASTDHLADCCQGAAPTADPGFTSIVGAFTASASVGSLSEPNGTAGHAYVGPNLQFQPTPEPATGLLILPAAALMLFRGLWRRWSTANSQ